jgi:hypothetical protein
MKTQTRMVTSSLLWLSLSFAFAFAFLTKSATAGQNRLPADYADDIYHCQDPWAVDEKESISCNQDSYRWELDELQADDPPNMCGDSFVMKPVELEDFPDWFEPCVLWALTFGNLAPTPTLSPASAPTFKPSLAGTFVRSFVRCRSACLRTVTYCNCTCSLWLLATA